MDKVTKLSGTVALGTAALAAIPAEAPAVTIFSDVEPNSTFATAQTISNMAVGDTINGTVDAPGDVIDFFHITGLPAGGTATFSLDLSLFSDLGDVEAGVYTDATTVLNPVDINAHPTSYVVSVPASGELVLGIKEKATATGLETYSIRLQSVNVPEPATVALVAAGLSGLAGLHVARRRKRG